MINNEELKIANMSYTNKDFAAIYPELLDLFKKVSPTYDPSLSNESDPVNVLLKLLAFVGDKINYNADKGVLETSILSAAQETSSRNICEMNGYFPKYYQSAETVISFRYDGKKLEGTEGDAFVLPAFETVISDVDGIISYTLLEPCTINKRKKVFTARAIQGTFETLSVGNKTKIQLTDLDDNNRVYLPEKMIAQNGVFIYNLDRNNIVSADDSEDGSAWKRVDNLNLVEPDSDGYYFKVGYDSEKGLPYVEFPDNIADLIESGLTILYCITKGAEGNVSASTLNTLVSPTNVTSVAGVSIDFTVSEDAEDTDAGNLIITNVSATINGEDIEGINSSYNNYKKTVGTFNTLTTCKDYANAIYKLVDSSTGYPFVSNVQVADRRTDINYGNRVTTFSDFGKALVVLDENTSNITPYDICLYPLKPMKNSYDIENYNDSFRPLPASLPIQSELEDLKTVSHNYKTISNSDIWAIKNYVKVNTTVTTTYKVNTFEQEAIKTAIQVALIKAFNGREVDYGYEIPFDSILDVIKNADPRIKNVILDTEEVPWVLSLNGEALLYSDIDKTKYLTMLAKNILAGRLPLFEYDTDFDYDFGQSKPSTVTTGSHKVDKIKRIKTETTVPAASVTGSTGYKVRKNEVIQLIAPNVASKITYPAYVNFRYEYTGSSGGTGCSSVVGSQPTQAEFSSAQSSSSDSDWYFRKSGKVEPSRIGRYVDASTGDVYEKAPSWSSGTTYYKIGTFGALHGEKGFIAANEEHKMASDEVLIINFTDSKDKKEHFVEYYNNKIVDNGVITNQDIVVIKPNFLIEPVTLYAVSKRSVINKEIPGKGEKGFYTLSTNETIENRELVSRIMNDINLFCYWNITSNNENQLFTSNDAILDEDEEVIGYEKLLGDNEYFAYCDEDKTELVILGSGTKLVYHSGAITDWSPWKCDKNLISKLTEKGLSVFEDFNWKVKSFNEHNLEVCDMQILTLVENDTLKITPDTGKTFTSDIKNEFIPVTDASISYVSDGNSGELPLSSVFEWKVRSRLDLNAGPKLKQELETNQEIDIIYDGVSGESTLECTKDSTNNSCIEFSVPVQKTGGESIDMTVTEISPAGITQSYKISAYYFNQTPISYKLFDNTDRLFVRTNGLATIPLSDLKAGTTEGTLIDINLPMASIGSSKQLLMLYLSCSTATSMGVTLTSTGGNIRRYPDGTAGTTLTLRDASAESPTGSEIFIVEVASGVTNLKISSTKDTDDEEKVKLYVGELTNIKGINPVLQVSSESEIVNVIKTLDTHNKFYYNMPVEKANIIEVKDMTSAAALWDRNNIYNKFTIGEIDFANSRIEIANSSKI